MNKARDVTREQSCERENENGVNGFRIVKEPACDGSGSVVITLVLCEHTKGFGPM